MNLKKYQFACEIMTEQFNHWTLFSIALAIMGSVAKPTANYVPNLWMWFVCALFPFALYWVRCKFDKILPFVLLHLAVILVAALIPTSTITYRTIYIMTAVYYVIDSYKLRFKKNTVYSTMISAPVALGLIFGMGLICTNMIQNKWQSYFLLSLLVVIALFFVVFYMQRYFEFLISNKSSAGYLPARDMFHSGLNLVLWFTGGCIVIFVLSMFTTVFGDVWKVVSDVFLKLLKYLISLLPESESTAMPTEQDTYVPGGMSGLSGGTFWLWELLQFVFLIALFITIIYLLIKLILKLLDFVQGRFKATRKTELEEDESIDVREKIEIEKRPERKRVNPFDRFSPAERIRRLYKKKLLNSTVVMYSSDADKLGIYTASEWEQKLQTGGMAAIYEQTRYSTREMTMADVKKMKEACKTVEE